QLCITSAGQVSSMSVYLGNNAAAISNQVVVTGTNSRWNINGDVYAGYSGSFNQLAIQNGGQARVSGDIYVGHFGSSNQLTIQNGGQVSNTNCFIGDDVEAAGNAVLVIGANSRWTNVGDLYVGNYGSGNQLMILTTGQVTSVNG